MCVCSSTLSLRAKRRNLAASAQLAQDCFVASLVAMTWLAHVSGVAERIAAGLRPHREPVRFLAHRDGLYRAARRVDVVNDIVEPPGQPELLSVDADIAHVGTATAGDRPDVLDLAGREVENRDATLAVRRPARRVRAAVGDIKFLAVAARVQSVGGDAGRA